MYILLKSIRVQRARIARKNSRGYVCFAAIYFAFSFVVVKPIQSKQVRKLRYYTIAGADTGVVLWVLKNPPSGKYTTS